jgi:phosphoenolpyruvate carboxykinase (GTP)
MADYFAHWLQMGKEKKMPAIYLVNWFQKDKEGRYIWPGFGENSRVLKWIFERAEGTAKGVSSPLGIHPAPESFDTRGLNVSNEALKTLFYIDKAGWLNEVEGLKTYFQMFKERFPEALRQSLKRLKERLESLS